MAWVGRDPEDRQAPLSLPQAGPPTSESNARPGCPCVTQSPAEAVVVESQVLSWGHGLPGDITSTVTSRALSLGPWLPPVSATAVSAAQERGHAASALVPAGSESGGG